MRAHPSYRTSGRPSWRSIARSVAILPLFAVLFASCEGRLLRFVIPFLRDFTFQIDSNNSTTDVGTLTRADILGELDIPDDATVEAVDIQSVRLGLSPGAGNTAVTATITFSYAGQMIARVINAPIVALDSGPVDELVASAVNALRSDFEAMLQGSGPASMTITASVSNISPSGARLVLDAALQVRISLQYADCVDINLLGVVGPEQECQTFPEF